MDFPYLKVNQDTFAPIVTLKILGRPKRWIDTEAYVDSGATYSLFREEIAEILGIKLEGSRKIFVTVGDGGSIPVYLHRLPVQFANTKFMATIGFSRKLGVEFNLLGRHSFFDNFVISFYERAKILRVLPA